jgi:hypothetical protein
MTIRETRTIKIKGKNVDDLDFEKLGNLIQQASTKSSRVDLKDLVKSLKAQLPSKKKTELSVLNERLEISVSCVHVSRKKLKQDGGL